MNNTFTYRPKSVSTNIGGYRYFFNRQEADNEVFGKMALHAFEFRMHNARLGRFWSVDPLAAKYPWNSSYAFAENMPIWARELEGLEAKISIAGSGGENTHYSKSDINAFEARALMLKKNGFENIQVQNGMSIINALMDATKKEGSILKIVSFAHSGPSGIFLNNNEGFYANPMFYSVNQYANVDMLATEVSKGTVKFESKAIWIFASCSTAYGFDNNSDDSQSPLAEYAAKTLHITTVGSTGSVYPEVINGKETGRLKTDGIFMEFEPYDVSITREIPKEHSFLFIKWTTKEKVTTTETRVRVTSLGKTIDPSEY